MSMRQCLGMAKGLAVLLTLLTCVALYQSRLFKVDASAGSLLFQDDPDYLLAQEVQQRYQIDDLLIVVYHPKEHDLFSTTGIQAVGSLSQSLLDVPGVKRVYSFLDAPLFKQQPFSLSETLSNLPTLRNEWIVKESAKSEFQSNPFYQDFLVSRSLEATALILFMDSGDKAAKIKTVIHDIRSVLSSYKSDADVFLGGMGMISHDIVMFLKKDLKSFGLGIMVLLSGVLYLVFQRKRWVVLSILCCLVALSFMMGILGTLGWQVTVISSSFISVQLIITLALILHLIMRYKELQGLHVEWPKEQIVAETIRQKFKPCLFAMVTSMVGFGSLGLSHILSVKMFGWMMLLGIAISFIVTFLLFGIVVFLSPNEKEVYPVRFCLFYPDYLGDIANMYPKKLLIGAVLLGGMSILGISRLDVENRFINYFKADTAIHRSLLYLDQHLGGTMPLDILLNFESDNLENKDESSGLPSIRTSQDALDFDEFDEFETRSNEADPKYWFTPYKIKQVKAIHRYLEEQPEIGKVISLASMVSLAEELTEGELSTFELAFLYQNLPSSIKSVVLEPFVSISDNQVRFQAYIKDSLPGLRRSDFLKRVSNGLLETVEVPSERVRLSGVMVLYNKMLQQLFKDQILTLGFVFLILWGLFFALFRSMAMAWIGMIPNVISVTCVLGLMGWAKIPLDMMTITIAAICMGIAVDDSIHYLYRFQKEYYRCNDYIKTMRYCHRTIGQAMFSTSLVVICGFSILIFSTFTPSIYFGILSSLGMFMALTFSLTILPALLLWVKPFKPRI